MTPLLDTFEPLYWLQEAQRARGRYMSKLVATWDKAIRQALNQFARALWPPRYALGLIPVPSYRLRSQRATSTTHVWWVERDIPPFDRYRCAAYRVQLSLGELGETIITVQSGDTNYTISPLMMESLEAALAQASHDVPLIIPRAMGRVEG